MTSRGGVRPERPPDPRRARLSAPGLPALLTAALVIAGIVFRLVIDRSTLGALGTDEATWGLMARHVLHGELSAFFWGQSYGGTQEVLPVAGLFAVFGTHLVLMRIVPIVFGVAASLVLWLGGRRRLGGRAAGTAGLLLWIWPIYSAWKLEIWSGFYGGGLLYGSLLLVLALELDVAPSRRLLALTGLVLGLGFWESLQLVAVFVPALAWLTFRRPRLWLDAWVALPAAALGSLPWVLSNLRHDWWSFSVLGGGSTYTARLRGFGSSTFPMILGLRVPFSELWVLGKPVSAVLYAAVLGGLAWCTWHWRRSPLSLMPAVIVLYPFLYALSEQTSTTAEPRYVMVLLPALALTIGAAASSTRAAIGLLAAAALLSAVGLARWIDHQNAGRTAALYDVGSVDVRPAISELDRLGIDRAYADYNIAYRMTFDTRERTIVSECDLTALSVNRSGRVLPPLPHGYRTHHHPAYDAAVRGARRYAYVLVEREPAAAHDVRLLIANGFTEHRLGTLLVLASP